MMSVTNVRPVNRSVLESLDPPVGVATWTEDAVMLYNLGVGAGSDDPRREVNLTTENSEGRQLQVVPTFGITLVEGGPDMLATVGVKGEDLLLVEETIELTRPLPTSGSSRATSRVVGVADHRRGYLLSMENTVVDAVSGELLFTTRSTSLVRSDRHGDEIASAPHREPAAASGPPVVSVGFGIAQNQGLLYRLTAGRNPLHSDPVVAQRVGYDVPLLHGRCTLGFAARHVIAEFCDGDADRLASLGGAFSAPVFPGDDLVMRLWGSASTGTFDIVRPRDSTAVMKRGTFSCRN